MNQSFIMDVEDTLREIRERVRAETIISARETGVDGERGDARRDDARQRDVGRLAPFADALMRLEANLATAERAWSRLPPVESYRKGFLARVELWMKRKIKGATHWYVWEQVNFNSATFHALRDAQAALDACRQELSRVASSLDYEIASLRQSLNDMVGLETSSLRESIKGLEARISQAESLRSVHEALRSEQQALRSEHEALRSEQDALRSKHDAASAEVRERIEHVLEEQRVSIKQLALEASERAIIQDRARRDVEARLERISKEANRE